MVRLGLIRHGHTPWNRAGRIQGRTDIALDNDAREDLARLRLPSSWSTSHLVASPLSRARETAELISGGKTPTLVPKLIEMDWGDWEGLKGAELRADPESAYCDIEDWGLGFCPPGGESVETVMERACVWAQTLTEDTLAVCHIGVMRVLLARATGWSFKGPAPFQIKRNRIFIIEIDGLNWHHDGDPIRLTEAPSCVS